MCLLGCMLGSVSSGLGAKATIAQGISLAHCYTVYKAPFCATGMSMVYVSFTAARYQLCKCCITMFVVTASTANDMAL